MITQRLYEVPVRVRNDFCSTPESSPLRTVPSRPAVHVEVSVIFVY